GLIPLRAGAHFLLAELSGAKRPVEVVAGVEIDPPRKQPADEPPAGAALTPVWRRDVRGDTAPILAADVIDGKAVVPLALHVEWLVHAAMHGNPGFSFHGLDHVQVLHGIKSRDAQSVNVNAVAAKARKQESTFVVPVELHGRRDDGRDMLFSR